MSWFDTNKIASMATKAMKEAQKTLDTALDIKEEEEGGGVHPEDSLWAGWKMTKSESDSRLTEKQTTMSTSLWGSFSGSFTDSSSGTHDDVVTSAPVSVVAPGHSSVLGGEDHDIELQLGAFTDNDKFER